MMEKEVFERLTRLEVRVDYAAEQLEQLDVALEEHREESRDKMDELKEVVLKIGAKIDEGAFRWSKVAQAIGTPENIKVVLLVIASVCGAAGGASALFSK